MTDSEIYGGEAVILCGVDPIHNMGTGSSSVNGSRMELCLSGVGITLAPFVER